MLDKISLAHFWYKHLAPPTDFFGKKEVWYSMNPVHETPCPTPSVTRGQVVATPCGTVEGEIGCSGDEGKPSLDILNKSNPHILQ